MSQTTTLAPSAASSMAMPRPMPRPPPVTMAACPHCPLSRDTGMRGGILSFRIPERRTSPTLRRHLDDHLQLRPLLVLGQGVALFGRGKAALRRQAQLIERNIFRRLVDAALDRVLGFEPAGLGGDQAEHDVAVLGHQLQRLEAAGALAVVFHEIAVHLDAVEQDLLLGLVAAGTHEGRFIIAAAQVHGDGHVGGNVRHRRVDEVAVERAHLLRIVAARASSARGISRRRAWR